MRKVIMVFLLAVLTVGTYAQKGDLFIGAKSGYVTNYKDFLYGLDLSYHLADPLEISLSGLMNPNLNTEKQGYDVKIQMVSVNLDLRYYILLQRTWAMGPAIGGQYLAINEKYDNDAKEEYSLNAPGFNIGWHLRFNLTEHIKLNGGWRYTTAKEDASHHLFYIGLGYTFNLY